MTWKLSRRDFARSIGTALGAAVVAPKIVEAAAQSAARRGADPAGAILLNSNENPYGPSPAAKQAIAASQQIASRYPDECEERILQAIAKYHGVSEDNVALGCGSGEILRMADMAFLSAGKRVVVAEPTFEAVLSYAQVTKADAVKVPQTADYRHDLPAMAAACNAQTGLVYVCNPNNPTGTIVTRDALAAFVAQVPRTTAILVDEAYHHFVEDPKYSSTMDWLGKHPNLIVVRTFSKIFGMAGMRLGYAVASKENIAAMRPHHAWNNVNAAVAEAANASLNDEAHVAAQRKLFNDTKRWLYAELKRDARGYIPSETNFVMIDVRGDVAPVIRAFRGKNIMVGRKFPSMPNYLRISIGTQQEMEKFMAGLREIVPAAKAA
jgi:histidinol-phosphate aminotransferase